MIADPTGTLCRALGTYLEEEGLSLRASFVIDPDGIIKAYEIHDNSIGRSAEELLRKLQAAKFVREHGGNVCPANWKPGGDTLKPGMDLVGKNDVRHAEDRGFNVKILRRRNALPLDRNAFHQIGKLE